MVQFNQLQLKGSENNCIKPYTGSDSELIMKPTIATKTPSIRYGGSIHLHS